MQKRNIIREARKARMREYDASLLCFKDRLYSFIRKIAKRYPDFFATFLDDIDLTDKEKLIVTYRYKLNKGWKEIPYMQGVNLELRQVMNLHKNFIDKINRF